MTVTVDPLAWLWLAASLIGALIAGLGLLDGLADIRALGDIRNGRRAIAWDYVRNQAGRLTLCLAWLYLGRHVYFDDHVTPVTEFTLILVGSNVLLLALAWLSRRTRAELLR